jgi:hypothetical protein
MTRKIRHLEDARIEVPAWNLNTVEPLWIQQYEACHTFDGKTGEDQVLYRFAQQRGQVLQAQALL